LALNKSYTSKNSLPHVALADIVSYIGQPILPCWQIGVGECEYWSWGPEASEGFSADESLLPALMLLFWFALPGPSSFPERA